MPRRKRSRTKLPPPGLKGTYEDTCVVCLRPTDTGIGLRGEAEWMAAALIVLGLPSDEAGAMISEATGSPPGRVPVGQIDCVIRLCGDCASKSTKPFPTPVLIGTGLPIPSALPIPFFIGPKREETDYPD